MQTLTRSELYKLVWQKPMIRLAREFGLSDVGVAKTCKKYGIPRPPRGYWARLAAGQKPKKLPLPEAEDVPIRIDIEANKLRRQDAQTDERLARETKEDIMETQKTEKHELALRVEKAFEAARIGEDGRVSIRRHTTPAISASPECADRIVGFLSALAHAVEARDIKLTSGKDNGEGLRFLRNGDIIHLMIEENLEVYEVEPTPEQKRQPSWTWNNRRTRPCGKLSFRLVSPVGTRGRCKWTESESSSAMELLPKVVGRVVALYDSWDTDREEKARREAEWAAAERRRAEEAVQENHRKQLKKVAKKRRLTLLRAAEGFRNYRDVLELIDACVSRWHENGELSPEQNAWVKWARAEAEDFNPLTAGYPVSAVGSKCTTCGHFKVHHFGRVIFYLGTGWVDKGFRGGGGEWEGGLRFAALGGAYSQNVPAGQGRGSPSPAGKELGRWRQARATVFVSKPGSPACAALHGREVAAGRLSARPRARRLALSWRR